MTEKSPLAQEIDKYISRGLTIVPICPGKKHLLTPGEYNMWHQSWSPMNDWAKFADETPSSFIIEQWKTWKNSGISLPLAGKNNIIALNFETDIHGLHKKIEAVAGKSPIQKRGSKGYTAFYRFNNERSYKWSVDNITVVELLSKGKHTVLPPTIHPLTEFPYYWSGDDAKALYEINTNDLPLLPSDFKEQIDTIVYGSRIKETIIPPTFFCDDLTYEEIIDALKFISPTIELKKSIGQSLNNHLGDTGFSAWNEWLSKTDLYTDIKSLEHEWSTLEPSSATIADLVSIAQQNGYARKQVTIIKPPTIITSENTSIADYMDYTKVLIPPSRCMAKLIDWMNAVAIKRQPVYSLSAAITACALALGHRVASETNLRTNIFAITLGASGSGKNQPMTAVSSLFNNCGLADYIGGEPQSGPAMIKSMAETKGIKLYQLDEIGLYLGNITGRNAQSYQSSILSNMMKLFSSAGQMFRGNEYANRDGSSPRKDINNPHLCVNGFSTPVRFWPALSPSHISDGFFARLLIFISDDPSPPMQVPANIYDPPQDLIDMFLEYNAMPTNTDNSGKAKSDDIRPQTVHFTNRAKVHLNEFYNYAEKQKIIQINRNSPTEALWARAYEHAVKLALCTYDFQDIDIDAAEWATLLTKISIHRSIFNIEENISDTQHESASKKVYRILRQSGQQGMPASEFARRTRWLTPREREIALSDLEDQGRLEIIRQTGSRDRGAPKKIYRAI